MIFDLLRSRAPDRQDGAALYDSAVAQARRPALYAVMGAPDTVEGRFELLTLHVILLVDRLGNCCDEAQARRQALFDLYIRNLDGALREMGVGDLAVGKRMKSLGRVFYGRAAAYESAFTALPETTPLAGLIERTVLEGASADSGALREYILQCRESLAAQALDELMSGKASWPPI